MDADVEEKRRNIIPRWRDFRTTLALGELKSAVHGAERVVEGSLDEQVAGWESNRSLAFAMDLVGAAFVLGKGQEVAHAIDFVLSNQSRATELQRRIARQTSDRAVSSDSFTADDISTSSDELISHSVEHVRRLRAQLRNAPIDPIGLVELAREYATLGSQKKALRAMNTAVGLGPANRFVLRSAARLYVHTGNYDRAHYVLKRAPSLTSDPWLLAAEIAVSSLMERTSSHARTGMNKISDSNYSAFEISELLSALATLEMTNANSKLARKLFKRALQRPTENSIAQAEWASRSMKIPSLEVRNFDAPKKYEALAWSNFMTGDWNNALEHGKGWILDQPFAVMPVLFSGVVASIVEDFTLSQSFYEFGLRANPESRLLRNNLAFALASNDEPDLAESELARIVRASMTTEDRIVTTATEGLIRFRKGMIEEGRTLYWRAIDLATEYKERTFRLRALGFLAREEIHARTKLALSALERFDKELQGYPAQELNVLLRKLQAIVKSNPSTFDVPPRPAKAKAKEHGENR